MITLRNIRMLIQKLKLCNKVYKGDINHKSKQSFSDLYEKTMRREEFLKKQGYNLITIWEDDYIKQMKKK